MVSWTSTITSDPGTPKKDVFPHLELISQGANLQALSLTPPSVVTMIFHYQLQQLHGWTVLAPSFTGVRHSLIGHMLQLALFIVACQMNNYPLVTNYHWPVGYCWIGPCQSLSTIIDHLLLQLKMWTCHQSSPSLSQLASLNTSTSHWCHYDPLCSPSLVTINHHWPSAIDHPHRTSCHYEAMHRSEEYRLAGCSIIPPAACRRPVPSRGRTSTQPLSDEHNLVWCNKNGGTSTG